MWQGNEQEYSQGRQANANGHRRSCESARDSGAEQRRAQDRANRSSGLHDAEDSRATPYYGLNVAGHQRIRARDRDVDGDDRRHDERHCRAGPDPSLAGLVPRAVGRLQLSGSRMAGAGCGDSRRKSGGRKDDANGDERVTSGRRKHHPADSWCESVGSLPQQMQRGIDGLQSITLHILRNCGLKRDVERERCKRGGRCERHEHEHGPSRRRCRKKQPTKRPYLRNLRGNHQRTRLPPLDGSVH